MRHWQIRKNGLPKVSPAHLQEPIPETKEKRLVEPERLSNSRDIVRARMIPGNNECGIAGREIEQTEDEERHE
jgi:hypothetical protein